MGDKNCQSSNAFFANAWMKTKDFTLNKAVPFFIKFYKNKILFCIVSAVIINLVIEFCGRMSVLEVLSQAFFNFHMFFYAVAVLSLTLFISCFFKRRLFAYFVIAATWIGLGICNGTILSYRSTPMIAIDFLIMRSSIGISTVYLSPFNIVLICLAVLACIPLLIFVFKKSPKEERDLKIAGISFVSSALVVALLATGFYFGNAVDKDTNLPDVYKKCGYVYCLTYSLFDYGVDEPDAYDKEYMQQIKDVLDNIEESCPEEKPNIVFLQLESYMDMDRIAGIELSESANPYFKYLKDNFPSGKLEVNALGASTANVEYEILTGTDIKNYGFDEYPYKTFLYDTPVETVAYNLKRLGYTTTSMHNHDGGFYGRYVAYSNLGFDRFIPRECMDNIELTPMGWCKDKTLIEQIKQTLNASEGRDFIFTVSVQCHSKYPKEPIEGFEYPIEVGGFDDEGYINQLKYYASQTLEEDAFLEELLNYFAKLDEKTVVVIYGDHLPTFIKKSEQLVEGVNSTTDTEKYLSEYVIWSNYGVESKLQDKNLTSQELSAYLLEAVGIRAGSVLKLYSSELDNKTRDEYIKAITYDAIEGKKYIYDENNSIATTDMDIGLTPLKITSYEIDDNSLFINGDGFSEYTYIYINDQLYTAKLVDSHVIRVAEEVTLKNGDSLVAKIITFDRLVLTESEPYTVNDLKDSVVVNKGVAGFHNILVTVIIGLAVIAVLVIAYFVYNKVIKKKSVE